MIRMQCYLPAPILEKLRELALQKDVAVAELIRRAVEEFLARQK